MRKLICTDGTSLNLLAKRSITKCLEMIHAETLDTVSLHHMGHPLHVMILDDAGYTKNLPINVEATKLYLANCQPGTTHSIRGDVIVVPDDDF